MSAVVLNPGSTSESLGLELSQVFQVILINSQGEEAPTQKTEGMARQ
jgi:hypothetical protein